MTYRSNSLFTEPLQQPLSREQRHRILWLAEHLSLDRVEGRRSHLVSPYTLQVLRVLLSYVSKRGECYPSLETLQERTGFARNTILKAIRQLEACRLLKRVRRITRRPVTRVNGLTGLLETVVLPVQTSNSYLFGFGAVKPAARPRPVERQFKSPSDHRKLELLTGLSFSRVQTAHCRDAEE